MVTHLSMKQSSTANDAVEVSFEERTLVLRIQASGTVDRVLEAYGNLLDDPSFSFDMNSIWDLSDFDLRGVSLGEIRRFAVAIREHMPRRGSRFKAALVTSRSVDFQLLRTYLVVLRLVGDLQLRAFTDQPSAIAWLDS